MRTVLIVASIVTALGAFGVPALHPPELGAPEPLTDAQRHVVNHLNGALDLLAERDVRSLTAAQRKHREQVVGLLRAYRDVGRFPENRDFAGEYVPYFVDRETGAVCAVGHLMAATGHQALVARIAAADNHVRIRELADDAEVVAWLDRYGLTLTEAARIQPQYSPGPIIVEPPAPVVGEGITLTLAGTSWILGGMQLATLSDFTRSRQLAPLGIFVSSMTLGAALLNSSERRADPASDAAMMIGATGLLLSGAVAIRAARSRASDPTVAAARAKQTALRRWHIAPTTDGRSFILAGRLRF